MTYRAIGLMSGSSLDGLDIVCAEFTFTSGLWQFEILAADCFSYSDPWKSKLGSAISLSARDYMLLHSEYGHYLGSEINRFIDKHNLHYKVGLISSHGHTVFHVPDQKTTTQLGNGASIAAETGLPVITDLRAVDVAFGGQGAPIVPIGEKLLLKEHDMFLNLGGIANLSVKSPQQLIAFDVCPANKVLNMIAETVGKEYDENGNMASSGIVNEQLLKKLNALEYYHKPYPKSLANDFGTDIIYPIVQSSGINTDNQLRTYVQHIVYQVQSAVSSLPPYTGNKKLLVTGGGALNAFLVKQLKIELEKLKIEVEVPEESIINFKEALIMAFIGVLRWRQEYNVLSSVTGAQRDSIGGALWTGQEA
jgi:anhydro-N-acetylmuramic acid kinase